MHFEQAIRHVEREFLILREELVAGKTDRWSVLSSAMTRHWNHCIENIALIEMQRPKATRVETEADWNRVARRVRSFSSPVFIVDVSAPDSERIAFGDHWLSDAAKDRPMLAVYDGLQTVGRSPHTNKHPLGSIVQTIEWAERLAQRRNIELIYDRLDTPGGYSLGGTIVADSRLEGPEQAVLLLSLLAREVLAGVHRASPPGDVPGLDAVEAELVTHTTATTAGLTSAPPQPQVPRLHDCGIVELIEMFRRVQRASSIILEGLREGFCEDLPV